MNNLITLHNFILLICNKRRFYNTNSLSTLLLSCWHCARDPIAALCARSYHTDPDPTLTYELAKSEITSFFTFLHPLNLTLSEYIRLVNLQLIPTLQYRLMAHPLELKQVTTLPWHFTPKGALFGPIYGIYVG